MCAHTARQNKYWSPVLPCEAACRRDTLCQVIIPAHGLDRHRWRATRTHMRQGPRVFECGRSHSCRGSVLGGGDREEANMATGEARSRQQSSSQPSDDEEGQWEVQT